MCPFCAYSLVRAPHQHNMVRWLQPVVAALGHLHVPDILVRRKNRPEANSASPQPTPTPTQAAYRLVTPHTTTPPPPKRGRKRGFAGKFTKKGKGNNRPEGKTSSPEPTTPAAGHTDTTASSSPTRTASPAASAPTDGTITYVTIPLHPSSSQAIPAQPGTLVDIARKNWHYVSVPCLPTMMDHAPLPVRAFSATHARVSSPRSSLAGSQGAYISLLECCGQHSRACPFPFAPLFGVA